MKTKLTSRRFPEARSTRRPVHVSAADPAASRVSFKSILVPLDFSTGSKAALRCAVELAARFKAKLTLLHVVVPVATPDFAYYPLMMENDEVIAAAKRELDGIAAKAGIDRALVAKTLVRTGVAFNEIVGAAESLRTDLIVISTHGYTGLKHVLLGSTTERVVRHAKCPVLVVR